MRGNEWGTRLPWRIRRAGSFFLIRGDIEGPVKPGMVRAFRRIRYHDTKVNRLLYALPDFLPASVWCPIQVDFPFCRGVLSTCQNLADEYGTIRLLNARLTKKILSLSGKKTSLFFVHSLIHIKGLNIRYAYLIGTAGARGPGGMR